jgi:sulfite exporter TauE/SafE
MIWQAIIAGGTLGLLSSFHCVGMCGPLALSLPVSHLSKQFQWIAIILYNAGRLITYTLLGSLLGILGHQIFLAGWQQWFSLLLGAVVMIYSIQFFFLRKVWQPSWLLGFHTAIQNIMLRLLNARLLIGFLCLGMANGLLPCGMVYLAIAGALSTADTSESIVFMLSFGLGTLPAMLALSLMSFRIDIAARRSIKKAMPYMAMTVAVLLILRGLNLGIPFISPVLASSTGTAASCH